MRFVERAVSRPSTCAVIPGRGAAEKEGFIDTGNELMGWDPHVYISFAGAREVARFIGWVDPESVAGLQEEVQVANDRIAELEQELNDAELDLQAKDRLERKGFALRQNKTKAA